MKQARWMFALMLTLLPLLASAQLSTPRIVAQVPFEFVVGNKVIPAGVLSLQPAMPGAPILSIRNQDRSVNLVSAFRSDETKQSAADYALVFHKYGNNCFLWGLKMKGSRTIYHLPQSKAEAELLARNAPATDVILLASLQ